MKKVILFLVVIIGLSMGLEKLGTILFPGNPVITAVAEAKTYYDWDSGGFKSVNETSGQTFDYETGEYGQDYSR